MTTSDNTDPVVDLTDDVTDDGVFHAVRDGYEAVYDALGHGETFNGIWRDNAYHGEFPIEFAHIGFLLDRAHQCRGRPFKIEGVTPDRRFGTNYRARLPCRTRWPVSVSALGCLSDTGTYAIGGRIGACCGARVRDGLSGRLLRLSPQGCCPGLVAAVEVACLDPEFLHQGGRGVSSLADLAIDDDGGGGERVELVA